ncbi:MAG: alpha/beta hydrolase [Pseudomonadota bacterium]|nr:alpha/beta hydrolase [Pseudomonadota bacterium]
MPLIQTPELTIHYAEAGAGPEVLVLLHGNFASCRWWQPCMARLPDGVRALAVDLRGCGDSDKPAAGYTIEQLGADLAAFIAALELPAVHVAGHSLGGAVALQFALDHPDRVKTLTLVASAPAEGLALHGDAPAAAGAGEGSSPLSAWLPTLTMNQPFLLQVLTQALSGPPGPGVDLHLLTEDTLRISPLAATGFTHALGRWSVQARLGEVTVPVLIVGGAHDPLVHPEALARTAASLPQARLEIWPDAGHNPHLEKPEAFRALLHEFLCATAPPDSAPSAPDATTSLWDWFGRWLGHPASDKDKK